MMHQSHEPFFSFTVPPIPTHNTLHQYPSPAPFQSGLLPSNPPAHQELATTSRPSTAGQFAFNVSSATPSATPLSASTRLPSNQPLTSGSSLATSLDRPYSSSHPSATPGLLQTVFNTHTYGSSYLTRPHHVFKSSFPNLAPHSNLASHSPLLTLANGSLSVKTIPHQHGRPMTAPGPSCVGCPDQGSGGQYSSAQHTGNHGRVSSYPPQPTDRLGLGLTIPQTANSQVEPNNANHLVPSPPGQSSALTGLDDATGRVPYESSSGCTDPHGRNSGEYPDSFANLNSESPHRLSGSGRPSLGTNSSGSAPASPESLDVDHSYAQSYLHSMPSNQFSHLIRPSTHSGALNSFDQERSFSETLHPRPATGYLPNYDAPSAYVPIQSQCQQYPLPLRLQVYPAHSSQIYANQGNYTHGPGSVEPKGHDGSYRFNLLPSAPRKRPRRRFDEVERLYCCNYPRCTKAYGTLNHLNAHISMQKHGPKRLPEEFKEIRKAWRAKKKAESEARAAMHSSNIYEPQNALSRPQIGLSCNSSPDCSIPSSNVGGPYSASALTH